MPVKDFYAEISKNLKIAPGIFHLKLKVNSNFRAIPGQFIMLKVNETNIPVLRRPFAILDQGKNSIDILYRVVGEGTEILSKKSVGDVLKMMGPLGNGFSITKGNAVIIAGGIGIASVYYLIKKLKGKGVVYFGAKTKNELVLTREIISAGASLQLSTEDGSAGARGMVTDILDEKIVMKSDVIYACGPVAMLKEVARLARRFNKLAYVSLEARMACGFGVCLGCVVPVKNSGGEEGEYMRVCYDGPVFDAEKINWEEIK